MIERLLGDGAPPRVTMIVAHPDDEVAGFGGMLRRLSTREAALELVHVTDGAPRNMRDASAAGFTERDEYARARRLELATALRVGGIAVRRAHVLGFVDQEASFALVPLARALAAILATSRPNIVVTHPYEGGHPDHDASAFAVFAAVSRLHSREQPMTIVEMTSYHGGPGGMRTGRFLQDPVPTERVVDLNEEECGVKQQMLDAFDTQRAVLTRFPITPERVRTAPSYDFTKPPHAGPLLYEHFQWGITGVEWRREAARALHTLLAAAGPDI
jgi:LmbE family N-acetylglucosaminyl deacetylase